MFSRKRRTRTLPTARPWLEALEIRVVPAGTWAQLTNLSPDANGTGTMLLLSNGKVMMLPEGLNTTAAPPAAFEQLSSNNWYTLTPDQFGNYQNGTWKATTPMTLGREWFASNVLPDGRLFVLGGEYTGVPGAQTYSTAGEIYNPNNNTWTPITPIPTPPVPFGLFGDGPSQVLPDGRILVGDTLDTLTWIYDPKKDTWTPGPTKLFDDQSQNETWVKMGDGTILSYDTWGYYNRYFRGDQHAIPFGAQKYVPSTTGGIGEWVPAGTVNYKLEWPDYGAFFFSSILEPNFNTSGPALLLNNGSVFEIGASGNTAIYTPGALPTDPGSWSAGPTVPPFPGNLPPDPAGADDAPAVELPNGHVMFAVDDVLPFISGGLYGEPPTVLYDYNPTTNSLSQVVTPPALTSELDGSVTEYIHMVVLPTGQVLLDDTNNDVWIYTPNDSAPASSKPTISFVSGGNESNTFTLTGTQFNGLSEGASFNSNAEEAENFPVVSLLGTHDSVYYVPTFNWSSNWVQTGSAEQTTNFTIPDIADGGPGPGAVPGERHRRRHLF